MARSRSGTRGRRGPRKPRKWTEGHGERRQVADPATRGAVEIPDSITVKELAELIGINSADVIRELIRSGIFATINQTIDRDTAALVTEELGFQVAEARPAEARGEVERRGRGRARHQGRPSSRRTTPTSSSSARPS